MNQPRPVHEDNLSHEDVISCVMRALDSKRAVIQHLFGESTIDYQREWAGRDTFSFWAHLDGGNRRRLIEYAVANHS